MSIWDTTAGKVVRALKGETSVIECTSLTQVGDSFLQDFATATLLYGICSRSRNTRV